MVKPREPIFSDSPLQFLLRYILVLHVFATTSAHRLLLTGNWQLVSCSKGYKFSAKKPMIHGCYTNKESKMPPLPALEVYPNLQPLHQMPYDYWGTGSITLWVKVYNSHGGRTGLSRHATSAPGGAQAVGHAARLASLLDPPLLPMGEGAHRVHQQALPPVHPQE